MQKISLLIIRSFTLLIQYLPKYSIYKDVNDHITPVHLNKK